MEINLEELSHRDRAQRLARGSSTTQISLIKLGNGGQPQGAWP